MNLLTNPGFESGLTGWNLNPQKDKTVTVDKSQHHSGAASLKFVSNPAPKIDGSPGSLSSTHATFSNQELPVNKNDYYEMSVFIKGGNGTEKIYFGWQELDSNNNSVGSWTSIISGGQIVTTDWKQYKGVNRIHSADTVKIKILFFGINRGTTYWDDFSLIGFNSKQFGCQNTIDSRCIKFSGLNSNSSVLSDNQGNKAMDAENFSGVITDSENVAYREVLAKKTVEIKIPAPKDFNANDSDMIVEIRYKDVFHYSDYITHNVLKGVTIQNKSPWFDSSTGSYFSGSYGFDNTGLYGNQAWLTGQTLFLNSKDNPKALKPIDGYYQFKITMPTLTLKDGDADPAFVIDYISINKLVQADSTAFIEFQKRTRVMRAAYLPDNNPAPAVAGNLTWFNSPSIELVLPYSKPSAQDTIKKPINAFSVIGEVEPINFSIYAKNNLKNLQFNIGSFSSSGNTILPANLSIKKVVYEERQWVGSIAGNTYGLLPDRLENFDKMDLNSDSLHHTQQFYLLVDLPKNQPGGMYSGNIDIMISGLKVDTIPITIDVLPVVLDSANHFNAISRNPYSNPTALTSKYQDLAIQNMVSHDMDTVIGNVSTITPMTGDGSSANPFKFNTESFNNTLNSSFEKGANQKLAMYQGLGGAATTIIKQLQKRDVNFTKSSALYDQLSDPLFVNAMGELVLELKQSMDNFNIQNKTNVTLILETSDEPGVDLTKRIQEDRIDRIIKAKGVKTFITYSSNANIELDCNEIDLCGSYTGKIPALAPLIDYRIYPVWHTGAIDNSGYLQGSEGYYTTYYSQLRDPVYNRFMSGLYAEKMDTKIIYNWVYYDNAGGDSFNDFDICSDRAFPRTAYDYVLAYPTWDGNINSSVSLEAMREGAKDGKYYATLQRLIDERLKINPNDQTAIKAKQFLENILSNVKSDWTKDYVNKKNDYGFGNEIIKSVSSTGNPTDYAVFDNIRKTMFNYIKQLGGGSVTIMADKAESSSGGIITYTVNFVNSVGTAIKNIKVNALIPNLTTYVANSASNSGSLINNEIIWNVNSLDIGKVFTATYKVKIN
ncbi:TPA: hypothetical protein DD449_02855 [Candidatus Berkelbacteria bacterium]|uniref:Uncharacterized protein n=1 Tax=Berkelbacteria bacterium GW2011_GWE1_39_12 TaxID=1618337 RepID=A0A0G4B353_9BACT|nr:MAG: hypothetical protein UT28_C0001G0199 [Berkelbacteria bacterium GW2011_GWE1_39_12]HBO60597.1 hypothetical protein [Candidatus Berkelbacteria bacterium]